jgi:hypothetical protein
VAPDAGVPVTPAVEAGIQAARGGGQSLSADVRGQMERALGADFGAVVIHDDTRADALNRVLQARAFTIGRDIFFRQGEYRPGSARGRQVLSHELAHVVQQGGDQVPSAGTPTSNTVQRSLWDDLKAFVRGIFRLRPSSQARGVYREPRRNWPVQGDTELAVASNSQSSAGIALVPATTGNLTVPTSPTRPVSQPVAPVISALQTPSTEEEWQKITDQARMLEREYNNFLNMAGLQPAHLQGLNDFIDTIRRDPLNDILKSIRSIDFSSRGAMASDFGGGVYILEKDTILLGGKAANDLREPLSPAGFMKLFLHEVGHARFQPQMFRGEMPSEIKAGAVNIDNPLARDDLTSQFSEDGKSLYRAWQILRQDKGKYLIGWKIGIRHNEADRQDYQAKGFHEFLAESFMHIMYETPKLSEHVSAISRSKTTPQEVREAWQRVYEILMRRRKDYLPNPM